MYVGVTLLYLVDSIFAAAPLMVPSVQSAKVYPYGLLQDADGANACELVVTILVVLLADEVAVEIDVEIDVEFGNAVHVLGYISTKLLLMFVFGPSMVRPPGPVMVS